MSIKKPTKKYFQSTFSLLILFKQESCIYVPNLIDLFMLNIFSSSQIKAHCCWRIKLSKAKSCEVLIVSTCYKAMHVPINSHIKLLPDIPSHQQQHQQQHPYNYRGVAANRFWTKFIIYASQKRADGNSTKFILYKYKVYFLD